MQEKALNRIAESIESLVMVVAGNLVASMQDADQKKKIQVLNNCGLSNTTIAKILGTTSDTVKVTLHGLRKSSKKKKSKNNKR